MKPCSKCAVNLPLSEFYKDRNQKSGLRPECKTCNKKKCSEWAKANRERRRGYGIKHQYGITVQTYDRLLAKQGGMCAICNRPSGKRRLAIDHCHSTGVVRGLLCTRCNQGLGHFQDNTDYLVNAAKYLQESRHVA